MRRVRPVLEGEASVTITEDHIKRGVAGSCSNCPAAIAAYETTGIPFMFDHGSADCFIKEDFPGDQEFLSLLRKKDRTRIKPGPIYTIHANLPQDLTGWIRYFDQFGDSHPITFDLKWSTTPVGKTVFPEYEFVSAKASQITTRNSSFVDNAIAKKGPAQ